jgi:hypothetical protein
LGLVTGAVIAAGAYHQPRVVVHHQPRVVVHQQPPVVVHHHPPHPHPHPRPSPPPPRWQDKPCPPHKHHRHHELGAAQVTVQLLNVRQNPGRHHPVIMQVPHGTYLSVQATSDRWLFVSLGDGRMGWVMKRHTTWGRPYADG